MKLPRDVVRKIEAMVADGRAASRGASVVRISAPAAFTPVPESAFQREVVALAEACGFRVAHFRKVLVKNGGRTYWATPTEGEGGKGWGDLVLARPGTVLFRELKTDVGRLKPEQKIWGDLLLSAGLDWKVWRPRDRDEIIATLTGGL